MKKSSYDNSFKVKIAIEAIKGDKTYEEIASTFGIAKSLITKWRDELVKNGALAFSSIAKYGAPAIMNTDQGCQYIYSTRFKTLVLISENYH